MRTRYRKTTHVGTSADESVVVLNKSWLLDEILAQQLNSGISNGRRVVVDSISNRSANICLGKKEGQLDERPVLK